MIQFCSKKVYVAAKVVAITQSTYVSQGVIEFKGGLSRPAPIPPCSSNSAHHGVHLPFLRVR